MKIGVDATVVNRKVSGVEKCILGLIKGLCLINKEDLHITVFTNNNFPKSFKIIHKNLNYTSLPFSGLSRLTRISCQQIMLPYTCIKHILDILVAGSYILPFF